SQANFSRTASWTARETKICPCGAWLMSLAATLTASPRQVKACRCSWPYMPLRNRPYVMPICSSDTAVPLGSSRSSSAAAKARSASFSCACGEDALRLTHERIELRRRGIVVVVDAAEPGEQRVGGAQLGQEFAASRPE